MRRVPPEVEGLDAAARALGGALLGPREITAALGFDPIAVLTPAEQAAVTRLPFGAAEIAFDTLLWERVHGERLLAAAWDWSRSVSTDQGYAALGEFGPHGLRVIAYSRAVRFGTLGVCAQR